MKKKKENKVEENKEDNAEEKKDIKSFINNDTKETINLMKIEESNKTSDNITQKIIEKNTNNANNNLMGNNNIKNNIINNSNADNTNSNNDNILKNVKKKITFKEAQQSIKDFSGLLNETEKKIKEKYGNCLPDFSCEEKLPIAWRTKLINDFFESDEMKKIVNKMKEEPTKK